MKIRLALGLTTLGLAMTTQATMIVANNTGHLDSSIVVIDNVDFGATDNRSGTSGGDPDNNAYGDSAWWSGGGNVSYAFTGLSAGTFNIYATFHHTGNNTGNGFTANGVAGADYLMFVAPDTSSGFTAYDEVNDLAAEVRNFQLIGTGIVAGAGTLDIVLSPAASGNGFGRYDAVAISSSAVPEPSSLALLIAGLAIVMLRRRK